MNAPTYANGFPDTNAMMNSAPPQAPTQTNTPNTPSNEPNYPSISSAAKIFEGYSSQQQNGGAQSGGYSYSINSGYGVAGNAVTNINEGQKDILKAHQEDHLSHQHVMGIEQSNNGQALTKAMNSSKEAMLSISSKMNGETNQIASTAEDLAEKMKCFFEGKCKRSKMLTNPQIFYQGMQNNVNINSESGSSSPYNSSSSSSSSFSSASSSMSAAPAGGISGSSENYEVNFIKLD
jgi:hypothetical protein